MEDLTIFVEQTIFSHKWGERLLILFPFIAPITFLNTVYDAWFGSAHIFVGLKEQVWVWFGMGISNAAAFINALPARHKARVIQWVLGIWTIETTCVLFAALIR